MGYQGRGPHEEIHVLDIALYLRATLDDYRDEIGYQMYQALLTRFDNFALDNDDLGTDLHRRAEIANGNVPGYRSEFGGLWAEQTRLCEYFISIHLNAPSEVNDYTKTYYDGIHLTERDFSAFAELMSQRIVNKVQNIHVEYPPPPFSAFYYSATLANPSSEGQDYAVLTNLDNWVTGVLTEPLMYTTLNGWLAMNDELRYVAFWINIGINDAIHAKVTGIEDGLGIVSAPSTLFPNNTAIFTGSWYDAAPPGDYIISSQWELYANSEEGTILLTSSDIWTNQYQYWECLVPSLANWNNTWIRDAENNNFVYAFVRVWGRDNDFVLHSDTRNLLIYSPPTTSGHVTHNENWAGTINITGDVTVNSNIKLTISPGTNIIFNNSDDQSSGKYSTKSELIIQGKLEADNSIFKSVSNNNNKGLWGGIWFNSPSDLTGSHIQNCEIKNGDYPLWIENCSPLIEGNTIRYASGTGLVVKGSNAHPIIRDNFINNVNNLGVSIVWDATPEIYRNVLSIPYRAAFYFNESAAGRIYDNDVFSGFTEYFYCYSNSGDPIIAGDINLGQNGNDIHNGSNRGTTIFRISGGSPCLGWYYYGTDWGNNALDIDQLGYYVQNYTGSLILAEHNWWGTASPSAAKFSPTALVDYDPPLLVNPLPKGIQGGDQEELISSIKAFLNKDYESAEQKFNNLFNKTVDDKISSIALRWMLASALKNGNFRAYENRLKAISSNSNDELRHIAKLALGKLYACTKRMKEAEQTLRSDKKGSDFERESLLTLLLYFIVLDEKEKAEDLAIELTDKFKETDIEKDIQMAYESKVFLEPGDFKLPELAKPSHESVVQASDIKNGLIASPNPFNPSTTITYVVENSGEIIIKIYNIIGEQIRSLVQAKMDPGVHSVVWDGKNDFNNCVGSGIYFVRSQTANSYKTLKISFLK